MSSAIFEDGGTMLVCYDVTGPSALIKKAEGLGDVKLQQTCKSLGQTELATCVHTLPKGVTITTHYYQAKHSDRYMRDCVTTAGGKWTTNQEVEADLERAKQRLGR